MPDTARAVFLSYRRGETRHMAGRLADRLTERLGSTRVFMDVDTIEPGADFAASVAREVASCDVLIALIGPTWTTIVDRHGQRRLDDPDDFVVLEIKAALQRDIRVIPVLIDGAVMPDQYDLPEELQGLARRNAVRLDHETFHSDFATLLDAVDRSLPNPDQKAARESNHYTQTGTTTNKQTRQPAQQVAGKGAVSISGAFGIIGGGVILLVLGYLLGVQIPWTLGIIVIVVGIIMVLLGVVRRCLEL